MQHLLAQHLKELGFAHIEFEYAFCEGRRWRADIAIPAHKLMIEIDGFHQGKHGAGWGKDNEKQNVAQAMGWRILRFTNRDIERGYAKEWIRGHIQTGEHVKGGVAD